VLRQPLEDGLVVISRAQGSVSVTFPAKVMLVRAMNPCPCGYHGDPTRECACSPGAVARYQKRLSGPLLDRIDVHVEVPRVAYDKLAGDSRGEPSAAIRARVQAARARQATRLAGSELLWGWASSPCPAAWSACMPERLRTWCGQTPEPPTSNHPRPAVTGAQRWPCLLTRPRGTCSGWPGA